VKNESANPAASTAGASKAPGVPAAVGRAAFQAELDRLREREKAHTREGGAIAAARRRLPMVEVDASLTLTGPHGPLSLLEAPEGRRQSIAYYFMWQPRPPRRRARGAEALDCSYALLDLTVYGRQEPWEYSPPGWPQQRSVTRTNGGSSDWPPVPVWPGGRPIARGLDSKLDALMTSPLGPERTRTTSSRVVTT
jgi:hypothetical protein